MERIFENFDNSSTWFSFTLDSFDGFVDSILSYRDNDNIIIYSKTELGNCDKKPALALCYMQTFLTPGEKVNTLLTVLSFAVINCTIFWAAVLDQITSRMGCVFLLLFLSLGKWASMTFSAPYCPFARVEFHVRSHCLGSQTVAAHDGQS